MYVLSFNLALIIDILIFFFRLTNHRFEKMERPHFSVQQCNQTQLKYEKLCLDFSYKAFYRENKFNLIYFQYFVNTNETELLCLVFYNTIINGKLIYKKDNNKDKNFPVNFGVTRFGNHWNPSFSLFIQFLDDHDDTFQAKILTHE